MKTSFLIKAVVIGAMVASIYTLGSCTKCYTCQAYILNNRVDFNKECGTQQEKQNMEDDFRTIYPDSLYNVTCN